MNANENNNWTWSQSQGTSQNTNPPVNFNAQMGTPVQQTVPPMNKPQNQFDLTNLNLNVNISSPQIQPFNANPQPMNLKNDLESSAQKANLLLNPTGNEEFDNFQTANTQENKKQASANVIVNIL